MYSTNNVLLQPRTDYTKFSFDASNRDISKEHVDRISESIDSLYLLDLYPLVVDANGFLRDGQHRFLSARFLQVPFYAIIADATIEQIAAANAATLRFTAEDMLTVCSKMRMPAYTYAASYAALLPGTRPPRQIRMHDSSMGAFMRFDFIAQRPAYAAEVARIDRDFRAVQKHIMYSKAYRGAFEVLAKTTNYDHKRMMNRLSYVPTRLLPAQKQTEALAILTEIYNYNLRGDNRVDLSKFRMDRVYDEKPIAGEKITPTRGLLSKYNVRIESSCDFAKFTRSPYRRDIPERNLESMVKAVAACNLLYCYPIVVDGNFTILDGQRRFYAAQKLGVPIHYIQSTNVSYPMIALASATRESWVLGDYLKHFCELQNSEYLKVRAFCHANKMSTDMLIRCTMPPARRTANYAMFRAGHAKFDWPRVEKWKNAINQFRAILDNERARMLGITIYRLIGEDVNADWRKLAASIETSDKLWTDGKIDKEKFYEAARNGKH